MASPKEQCFQDALEAWQDATGKDLGIQFEQPWVKDAAGNWTAPERHWWALVNSLRKFKRWLLGESDVPGSVTELRRPDITMPGPNGKPQVVDLKFTDKDGNVDPWRQGQKDAYRDINKQNQGDEADATALDKNSCKCEGEPQREEVVDPALAPNPFFAPLPAPGVSPAPLFGPGTAPVAPPAPAPIIEPLPVFP